MLTESYRSLGGAQAHLQVNRLLYSEDEGTMLLRNIGNCLPAGTRHIPKDFTLYHRSCGNIERCKKYVTTPNVYGLKNYLK
jgi:hypothetical protein